MATSDILTIGGPKIGSTSEQLAQAGSFWRNAFGPRGGAAAADVTPAAGTAADVATELAGPVADAASTPDLASVLAGAATPAALESRPTVPEATIAEGGESVVDKFLGQLRGARQGVEERGGIGNLMDILSRPKGGATASAAEAVAPTIDVAASLGGKLAAATPAATEVAESLGTRGQTALERMTEALGKLHG